MVSKHDGERQLSAYERAMVQAARDLRHNVKSPAYSVEGFLELLDGELLSTITSGAELLARHAQREQILQVATRMAYQKRTPQRVHAVAALQEVVGAQRAQALAAVGVQQSDVAGLDESAIAWLSQVAELLDFLGRARSSARALMILVGARTDLAYDQLGPVDIHETIAAALAVWWRPIERDGGTVTLFLHAERPVIKGDLGALASAWSNLIENAHAATQAPGLELTITTTTDAAGVHVTVADNGPGIPEHIRSTLFEPGVSTKSGGGLGLDYVRRVVEMHRGTVRVDVTPTQFHFTFPA